MKEKYWVEILESNDSIDLRYYPLDERQIRRAISSLRKQDIFYIPVGKYEYVKINSDTPDEIIERYLNREMRHLGTQYFNTVRPLINYVKDSNKKKLYGTLFSVMEELK